MSRVREGSLVGSNSQQTDLRNDKLDCSLYFVNAVRKAVFACK